MFKRILVALKFGPAGIDALKKSAELARVSGAELHIFHALDYSLKDTDETAPEFVEIKKKIESQYKAEIEPLTAGLTNVMFKCLPADPALEVCRLARNIPADLVVLGCHQLSQKISMGRLDYVGITILEKAPCPVMLVPYISSS
ncbi:MAG: universal stress protein [Desulfobacterales bacterium]|nr:MAG: universal stress protein [Desulfobacterales bacterium]